MEEDIQDQQKEREETVSVGGRRYDLRFQPLDDGRVSVFASGRQDGEVVAELSAVLPQSDAAAIGCTIGLFASPAISLDRSIPNRYDVIRQQSPNAYRPWSEEDEVRLVELYRDGNTIAELAATLGRKPGGIRSRLVRLGEIADPAQNRPR